MSEDHKLPDLPKEVQNSIDNLLRKAGEARRAGNAQEEERLALEAWDTLPEPKLGWNYYSNIMPFDNVGFFRDVREFDKALRWLDVTRQSYGSTPDSPDSAIEFLAATVYFEMGDLDKAFEIFDWQFKNWNKRPFEGENRKYLDFYLSRKGKK